MNPCSDISDEEFVPFLHSLGVETYKKSFEWMINDADFAGVLRWLYNNLDHRNALNAREEYRYAELRKKGALLPPEELESTISSIQEQYVGIPLPCDQDAMEDLKTDIAMYKERLSFLEKQQDVFEQLITQNQITKENLNSDIANLNSMQSLSKEDESKASKDCLNLAQEVERATESIIDVVADNLDLYFNCHNDMDIAKKFFAFGPFESYKQTQALFRSHFDLYTSRRFNKQRNGSHELDLQTALIEAKEMEERMGNAITSYIHSKAELAGEQATLYLLANYENSHPSEATSTASIETRSEVELLEQEACIVDQQLQSAVRSYVERRTGVVVDTAIRAALDDRQELVRDLSLLHTVVQTAHALDTALYYALRHSLRAVQDAVQFARDLRCAVDEDRHAVCSRIESMTAICNEQQLCHNKLQNRDCLLASMSAIFGVAPSSDVTSLVKLAADVRSDVTELKERVADEFRRREDSLRDFKHSLQPLISYLWDGCTKQPNCNDRAVAALTHSLTRELSNTDKLVEEVRELYVAVKNGDKHNLRKLWQWFLTDPSKLIAVVKETQSKSFS